MQCPACREEVQPGAKFCGACGATLPRVCAHCGHHNAGDARFCAECGTAIASVAEKPPAPPVAADITAGERRHLTVLFCDLVGSTALSSVLDPEDYQEVLQRYQAITGAVIARLGGHVVQYLGDGILAYFGYPAAFENDAERAVRAGLETLASIGGLGGLPKDIRLAVRIGVHTGLVVVGDMGTHEHVGRLAVGETLNVAARVQASAEPDTLVISGATYRLVAGLFLVEDLGVHTLKGLAEPIILYRVQQSTGVRGRLQAAAGPLTPFVGRRQERALLADRWQRVRDGEGQMVLITGEAGIGKSRLVQIFHDDVMQAGDAYGWMECTASPFYQNTPFRPVVELLQQALAIPADRAAADPAAALEALEQRLTLAGIAPADAIPVLAPLLDLAVPDDRYPPLLLSAEQQRARTFTTLTTWLLALAQDQPTILVLDDLQWFDPSTIELLELVARQGATVPLMLVCTARPEFRPPWPLRSHHLQVTLMRLDKSEAQAMAAQVVGDRVLPAVLVEMIAARTDGVPLFVEELTKSLLESDAIVAAVEAIPETLQDSLMARLDRLGEAKAVAQTAAVLGREFSYALLQGVASMAEPDLDAALDRLVDAELIYARGFRPDARYVFKHALVQSAAYESLLKKRRQELHAKAAQVLRERFPEIAEVQPEVLAHHHSEAREAEAAAAAWQRAAERAGLRGAHGEAISHYQRALAMLATLADSPARTQQELIVQLAVVQLLWYVKGWGSPEAQQANTRARELAERLGDPGQAFFVLLGREVAALVGGEMQVANELAEQLLELADRTGDTSMRVWAHFSKGAVCYHRGQLEVARTHFEQAIALYDEAPPPPFFADSGVPSHAYAGLVACHTGFADRARAESDAAIALARRLGRPNDIGFALQVSAYLYLMLRDPARVAAAADELGTLAAEHDFPMQRALATIFGAWARAEDGRLAEGTGPVRTALHNLALAKNGIARGFHLGILAQIEDRLGALADALRTSEDALGAAPEDAVYHPDLLRLRADLLARSGAEPGIVEAVLRESIAVAREQGARLFWLRSATRLGALLASCGRGDEVHALVTPVYQQFTEGFDIPDVRDAETLLATVQVASAPLAKTSR